MNLYLAPTASLPATPHPNTRFIEDHGISAPASTFVFQDVNPQNICTPAFIVTMLGIGPTAFSITRPRTIPVRGVSLQMATRKPSLAGPATTVTLPLGQKLGHDRFPRITPI